MTSEKWPQNLPLPTIAGYGVAPGEAILRTEMEAGPARQRRRFTQVPSRVTVRWVMDDWKYALFESWYKHKAKEGTVWFDINLYGGIGTAVQEARFAGQFQASLIGGGHWEVTSEIEIRDRPVLSEGAMEVALTEDITGLIAAINHFGAAVNRNLPIGWNG